MTNKSPFLLIDYFGQKLNGLLESPSFASMDIEMRAYRRSNGLTFQAQGLPDKSREGWKYTPIPAVNFEIMDGHEFFDVEIDPYWLERLKIEGSLTAFIINGHFEESISDDLTGTGVRILSIQDEAIQPVLLNALQSASKNSFEPFVHLSNALFDRGIYIEKQRNAVVSKPIHLIHVFSQGNTMLNIKNFFKCSEGSEMDWMDSYVGFGLTENLFVNETNHGIIEKDSIANHAVLQNMGVFSSTISRSSVKTHQSSRYARSTFSIKGGYTRNEINCRFEERYGEINLNGFYLGEGTQLIDNHTFIDHLKPDCLSNEWYKGVLFDHATGVFNGKIKVEKDAQKTLAYQKNNTVVLGTGASMNAKPELEIFADDVKCSHGSTIGQLDKNSIFYLRSRGLSEKIASMLLVKAFAHEITEKVSTQVFKDYVVDLINQHLQERENDE